MPEKNKMIIAIDGYSSCGKSTLARQVAAELGYIYIDSGAMYRAVTLYCIESKIATGKEINLEVLKKRISGIRIEFHFNRISQQNETFLNGKNVEEEIRQIEVSNLVSPVSKIDFVRHALVEQQRHMGRKKGIVMDGRDIGTVVFPDADLKVFMTALPEVRAQRRYDELTAKGVTVSMQEIIDNIKQRDYIDSNREISPLRKADDAITLDNSYMSREEQLNWVLKLINERS